MTYINLMFKKQVLLDELIIEKKNNGCWPTLVQVQLALLDEIGELNHALKANWCFWKKSQKPINKEEAFEELIDCLHFVLMKVHVNSHFSGAKKLPEFGYELAYRYIPKNTRLDQVLLAIPTADFYTSLDCIFYLASYYFDAGEEEVFDAYCKKWEINMKRARGNY